MSSDKMDTWNNTCIKCGTLKVTHGDEIMGQCQCGSWRFLCHLVEEVAKDATPLPSNPTGSVIPHQPIMQSINWQGKQDTTLKLGGSDTMETEKPENGHRGRPQTAIPEDLLKELSAQGHGCMVIAQKLTEQGIPVHYSTVWRQLKKSITQGTNQNKKGVIANASDK